MPSDTGGLVPEDFDLDAARAATSSTPPEERPRCPECTGVNIRSRGARRGDHPKHPETYWCMTCGARFDDPLPPEVLDHAE